MSAESEAAMTQAFKATRDFLLAHRTDYARAYRDFRWPELDRFNWALDWFDAELARGEGGNRPALRIVSRRPRESSSAPGSSATTTAKSRSSIATASKRPLASVIGSTTSGSSGCSDGTRLRSKHSLQKLDELVR